MPDSSKTTTTNWPRVLVVVPAVLAVTLSIFAWPAARLSPRDLPFGVAGPASVTRPVEQSLARQHGAFDVHRYADEQGARRAIKDRDVYGALVVAPSGETLLTATAASPSVATMLEQTFAAPESSSTSAHGPQTPRVVDVVPADRDDPHGSAFGALVLPLVLSSVGLALAVALSTVPGVRQAVLLGGAALLGGLVATALMQSWLGVIGGSWVVNAGVISLIMLAIASALAGLKALGGYVGFGLGAALMVLVGNAWSGISSAPEMLPKPVGLIGQLLPPGAGGNLLRSTAFFDRAGGYGHLAVLLVWAGLGVAAILTGALVRRRRALHAPRSLEPEIRAAGQTA